MFQKVFLKLTRAGRFRSGMIVLCAIGAIMLLATGVSPLLALGTVTVRVDPAIRAAPVNGTFTVDIVADLGAEMDPNGLGAYEFDLVYDKDYLEVVTDGVTDAGELGATGRTVAELGPSVDNENGRTTFAAYSHPPEDVNGPGGTVGLATVTLQANRAGVTALNLENALMADTQANAWPDGGAGRELSLQGADIRGYTVGGNFDVDINSDPAVWVPQWNRFYWLQSGSSYARTTQWLGWTNAVAVPADYDGDGEFDPAVWRPDTNRFVVKRSGSSYEMWDIWLGWTGAIPVPCDFDGDGNADPAVWVPQWNRFYWLQSGSSYVQTTQWLGWTDAIPQPADYDGDGLCDPAVWRPDTNRFVAKRSGSGYEKHKGYRGECGNVCIPLISSQLSGPAGNCSH
jgi:hypothetical protein